jgi:hypothetical protein
MAMATLRSVTDVLGEFYNENRSNPDWQEFFAVHDIAMPLAWMTWQGYAKPTEISYGFINETWVSFCESFEVDSSNDFASLDELMDCAMSAQPNEESS